MEFKNGTSVYSSDGQEVGRIDRVVLDPSTNEVTHLVVRQGLLFTEDKVIPLDLVQQAAEDRVTLRERAYALELPEFEETYYVDAHGTYTEDVPGGYPTDYAAPLYGYPPVGTSWWAYPGYIGAPVNTATPVATERNIPDHTVALKEGARVISRDDHHVGNVERVFVDAATNRATHLLISQGLIFKNRKLVPTSWVRQTSEDEVILTTSASSLERLPDYSE